MKRSILMLIVMSAALIIFGCEKMEEVYPESNVNDEEMTALKGAKAKRSFEGICTFVEPVPNTWYDDMDDWRVTGTTIWEVTGPEFEGTAELFVEAKNPHKENRGKWDMTWKGSITPTDEGTLIVAIAEGIGVGGKVKGMKASWTYTMNYVGDDDPNPGNPTFFYSVEGNIEKPQGPIKKD